MTANEVEGIEKRLTRLEREVKHWERAAAAALVLLAALIAFSLTPRTREARVPDSSAKDLVASSLVIVDEHGQGRILLGTDKDGALLELYDQKKTRRAGLRISKDQPVLGLFDEKETLRAGLRVSKDQPSLTLFDERGTRRAKLLADNQGSALGLSDEKGTLRAGLGVTNKDGLALELHDEKGTLRAAVGSARLETQLTPGAIEQTAPGSVTLFDKNGKLIWRAP